MKSNIVGIDVGVQTGIAIFNEGLLKNLLTLNVYDTICLLQNSYNTIDTIIMEDPRLQSYIWNKNNKGISAMGRHARNIGSVDGSVRIINEACNGLKIDIRLISPKHKGRKITQDQFSLMFPYWNCKRTNQHERDAVMCVMSSNPHYCTI